MFLVVIGALLAATVALVAAGRYVQQWVRRRARATRHARSIAELDRLCPRVTPRPSSSRVTVISARKTSPPPSRPSAVASSLRIAAERHRNQKSSAPGYAAMPASPPPLPPMMASRPPPQMLSKTASSSAPIVQWTTSPPARPRASPGNFDGFASSSTLNATAPLTRRRSPARQRGESSMSKKARTLPSTKDDRKRRFVLPPSPAVSSRGVSPLVDGKRHKPDRIELNFEANGFASKGVQVEDTRMDDRAVASSVPSDVSDRDVDEGELLIEMPPAAEGELDDGAPPSSPIGVRVEDKDWEGNGRIPDEVEELPHSDIFHNRRLSRAPLRNPKPLAPEELFDDEEVMLRFRRNDKEVVSTCSTGSGFEFYICSTWQGQRY
ncbi:unnamed protein product (mitochondrion) [Plasmodiophora brassicae]|uniref:Uncharacterized protein n=1 Tax=Plasmodiophora brassicae TaxID=37360 RepID=A0A3P3YBV8_PLABS|nr:unnamed protein product [Plasmodiophora brassicae]